MHHEYGICHTGPNCQNLLFSPRAKRADPKGLRAESARAVTGKRCPHSGEGEDFLTRRPCSFYENVLNSGTETSFPMWEMKKTFTT